MTCSTMHICSPEEVNVRGSYIIPSENILPKAPQYKGSYLSMERMFKTTIDRLSNRHGRCQDCQFRSVWKPRWTTALEAPLDKGRVSTTLVSCFICDRTTADLVRHARVHASFPNQHRVSATAEHVCVFQLIFGAPYLIPILI